MLFHLPVVAFRDLERKRKAGQHNVLNSFHTAKSRPPAHSLSTLIASFLLGPSLRQNGLDFLVRIFHPEACPHLLDRLEQKNAPVPPELSHWLESTHHCLVAAAAVVQSSVFVSSKPYFHSPLSLQSPTAEMATPLG